METDPVARTAKAACLLSALAVVPEDDEGLDACRREAARFEPEEAAVDLLLDLLSPETDPEGFEETCSVLEGFIAAIPAADPRGTALRLLEGLARLEAAEPEIEGERARRLRSAMSAAYRAGQGSSP